MNEKETSATTHDTPRVRVKQLHKRAIDGVTIAEIARLCAKLLTEAEACRQLGVNPASWRNWKSRNRNSEKFAALLESFRANRIDDLISKIENSADGIGMKQPDWRAAAYLLQITDRKFNPSAVAVIEMQQAPVVNVHVFTAAVRQIYGDELARQLSEAGQVKQLPPADSDHALPEPKEAE